MKIKPSEGCGHLMTLHCKHSQLAADAKLVPKTGNRANEWDPAEINFVTRLPDNKGSIEFEINRMEHTAKNAEEYTWLIYGIVDQYLKLAIEALNGKSSFSRAKPLISLYWEKPEADPTGGAMYQKVFELFYTVINNEKVDICLCSDDYDTFQMLSMARNLFCPFEGGPFWMLSENLKAHGKRLRRTAQKGQLSVFIGAGVSIPSGLPSWSSLLQALAKEANFSEEECRDLSALAYIDQPILIEKRMGEKRFRSAVAKIVSDGMYTPGHVLTKQLNVPVITTNYDDLYELACRESNEEVLRLPWDRNKFLNSSSAKSILKLHGCVEDPESIILTRKDYIRFADDRLALRGRVMDLLLESEMLFIGFSMTDDNVHIIIDAVEKVLKKTVASVSSLGTVLSLIENKMFEEYWSGRFQTVFCGNSWDDSPTWIHDCFLNFIASGFFLF